MEPGKRIEACFSVEFIVASYPFMDGASYKRLIIKGNDLFAGGKGQV
jgi:hypothetical protein